MNALKRYKDSQQAEAKGFADGLMVLVKLSVLTLAKEYGFGEKRIMRFINAFDDLWVEMNQKCRGYDNHGNVIKSDLAEIYDGYLDAKIETNTDMIFRTTQDGKLYIGHKRHKNDKLE